MLGFALSNIAAGTSTRVPQGHNVCRSQRRPHRCASRPIRMAAEASSAEGEVETFPKLKEFFDDAKKLGYFRIIVRNAAAIQEAISSFEKLFYARGPGGAEYANVIDHKINLDLHVKMEEVGGVRFENGVSRGDTKAPTYIMRFFGKDKDDIVLSLFMSGQSSITDVDEERVKLWEAAKAKYADEDGIFTL